MRTGPQAWDHALIKEAPDGAPAPSAVRTTQEGAGYHQAAGPRPKSTVLAP